MNGDASIAAGSVDTVENSLTFFLNHPSLTGRAVCTWVNCSIAAGRINRGERPFFPSFLVFKSVGKVLGTALQALWEDRGDQKQLDRGRTELYILQASSQASVCVPWAWGGAAAVLAVGRVALHAKPLTNLPEQPSSGYLHPCCCTGARAVCYYSPAQLVL